MMKILIIVAHPDDEVLGCGGSMATWVDQGHNVRVLFMSDGVSLRTAAPDYPITSAELVQQRKDAAKRAASRLGARLPDFLDFPDNQLDSVPLLKIIKAVEPVIESFHPDLVVTHHNNDLNIDHQITQKAVVTACRPQPGLSVKRILACEVPSSTEWQDPGSGPYFTPNWYVDISEHLETKLSALTEYSDELREWPHSRSIDAVRHLARWRGATVGRPAAEAFMLIRNID